MVHRSACATIIFWNGSSGWLPAPLDAFGSLAGSAVPLPDEMGWDRSRVVAADSMCCSRLASAALLFGLVVPNAQIRFALVEPSDCIRGGH